MKSKVENRMKRKNRVLNKLKRRMLSLLLKMSTITDFFYIYFLTRGCEMNVLDMNEQALRRRLHNRKVLKKMEKGEAQTRKKTRKYKQTQGRKTTK